MSENKAIGKYVVYGAGYTRNDGCGIRVYDFNPDSGRISLKDSVKITNASYITISHNRKFLYSITDDGVAAFRIKADGGLDFLNMTDINGMRGCYLNTDYEDRFVFVAGYHDGKITVLSINSDGSVNKICDEIYQKGVGTIAERNFRPHVDCVKMTRDNKYLCATDVGMDQIKVYRLNHETGKLKLEDIIRSDIESAPHHIKFSLDGKFAYIIHELKNIIDVYSYEEVDDEPVFKKIQTVPTVEKDPSNMTAAYALHLSDDDKYIYCSNAGDDSVGLFERDKETGLLKELFVLPVSGQFPKDIAMSDDNRFLLSMNHETNTISFFRVNLQDKTLIMNGGFEPFNAGNCILIHRL